MTASKSNAKREGGGLASMRGEQVRVGWMVYVIEDMFVLTLPLRLSHSQYAEFALQSESRLFYMRLRRATNTASMAKKATGADRAEAAPM